MNQPTPPTPIPVIILAGFLGAGKTTALNHLLRQADGRKIGVIVNDFGEINIDALLVQQQTKSTMELAGGCICCQLGDGDLDEALANFTNSTSPPDCIIIEASGIAEPTDIKKLILYSANKSLQFGGIVYLIDASEFHAASTSHPQLRDHVGASDLLVLNKADLVSPAQLETLETEITTIHPAAPFLRTTNGAIDIRLLFEHPAAPSQQLQLGSHSHNLHLHDAFTSVSFSTSQPLSPVRVKKLLQALPPQVYRLKGALYYGMKGFEQKIIIHKVGGHVSQYAEEWQSGETPGSSLVAIGVAIDEAALQQQFSACIDPNPDNSTPGDMVDIMRLKGF